MMRERFWTLYNKQKYNYFYFSFYKLHCETVSSRLKIFLALASCGSIAAWNIWETVPFLWAIIFAIAQVASVVEQHLPFVQESNALQFYLPDLHKILIEISYSWDTLGSLSDGDIAILIHDYEKAIAELDDKYLGGLKLDPNKKCAERATHEQKQFFAFYEMEQNEQTTKEGF